MQLIKYKADDYRISTKQSKAKQGEHAKQEGNKDANRI